jgi:hypothetical protein
MVINSSCYSCLQLCLCFFWHEILEFLRFKEKFEYAILRGNEKKASDREKRIGSTVAKVMIYLMVILCFVLLSPWVLLDGVIEVLSSILCVCV